MSTSLSPNHIPEPTANGHRVLVQATNRTDPVSGAWLPTPLETVTIPDRLHFPGLLVVRMENASMEPVLRRHALVGIDRAHAALESGQLYALDIVPEGLVLIRVMVERENGRYVLQSENGQPPRHYPFAAPGLTSIGRVVWVIQEL